ncbi:MAG: hypothetical protein WCL60_01730 [Methylococcales bacterium]
MSITLEAFSPVDAVAIIRSNQDLRLCRPPYKQNNTIKVPESAIEDAVLNYDFHASGASFENWAAVIHFLNQQLIAYRESSGRPVPETLNMIEILDVAPLTVLQNFLKKVENELIPERQFAHAKHFLIALLKSHATQEHPELITTAANLLEQINHFEYSKSNSATVLEKQYSPFKNLPEKANSKADYVRKHGFFGSLEHAHALAS